MDVQERMSGDRAELGRRIAAEKNAKQRDRYRAAALAIDGREAEAIAGTLSRSRRFVQRWAYAYRDDGIDAIAVKKQKGPKVRLTLDEQARLARRVEAGPLPGDGVCTLRGRNIVEILRAEFEKPYSLNGVYDLLHRMGFSSLRPRPRHRKNDPAVMEAFKTSAPFLSTPCVNATKTSRLKSGSRTKPALVSRAH